MSLPSKIITVLAITTGCLLSPAGMQSAQANMSCNTFGSRTTCYGSDGSSYSGNTFGGRTTFYGTDSNGDSYSGSCNSFGSQTTCY